jgi:hypothetical protein
VLPGASALPGQITSAFEGRSGNASAEPLDQPDEVIPAIAVLPSELDELAGAGDDRAALRGARNADPSPATELE